MKIDIDKIQKRLNRLKLLISNWALFSVIFASLFVWPFFGDSAVKEVVFNLFITLVIVLSVFAVSGDESKKMVVHVGFTLVALWITRTIQMPVINGLLRGVVIFYFITVVFKFIALVSERKKVDNYVIIEAINGYLLLGISFSLLIAFSITYFPEAFNFTLPDDGSMPYDPFYYSFVTLSTLGYGDKLPLEDPAKAVSLLITLSGQFYLVTVMAFIVGKMLTKNKEN
ncbi:MAG: two pore domain potassium channel family protein [Chlorobi bacterium]|nr:two pore domain potassium channel family protein [Chlorobiota bacterium]